MTDAGVGLAGRTQGLLARRSVSCNGGIVPRRHPNGGGADRPSIPPTSIPPSSTPVLPVIGAENVDRLSIASTFGLGEALRSLASSPDGTILALAGGKTEDFAIRLYDVAGGARPVRPASTRPGAWRCPAVAGADRRERCAARPIRPTMPSIGMTRTSCD